MDILQMIEFYRIAHQTIQSGLVVRWKEIGPPGGLTISASRDGVAISGHSPVMAPIQNVVDVLERAYNLHAMIKNGNMRSSDIDAMPLSREPDCVVETRHAVFAGDDTLIERRN